MITILTGDVRDMLKTLPNESVHCVVTSPPYWGLRDYGTAEWEGGDADCDHLNGPLASNKSTLQGYTSDRVKLATGGMPFKEICGKCGARRVDKQIGMELTMGEHIAVMVDVFREVRRVMRKDATCWLNYGDCYISGQGGRQSNDGAKPKTAKTMAQAPWNGNKPGAVTSKIVPTELAPKQLAMIPNRIAIALQDDGWWVRSEIIWAKPNPMPESITDRPATAHEKVWLLTKSARYFYDAEAVRMASTWNPDKTKMPDGWDTGPGAHGTVHRNGREKGRSRAVPPRHAQYESSDRTSLNDIGRGSANLKNVWTIPTKGFSEAHFATYPPALVETCIKAGTSEKGCCAECGEPWVRETEKEFLSLKSKRPNITGQANMQGWEGTENGHIRSTTTGWSPSCQCNAATIPCTVLDPFIGSGTTAMVADRLGRDCIGIDLNPEYAEMAKGRIRDDAGMFAEIT